jgi:hypothetical protein
MPPAPPPEDAPHPVPANPPPPPPPATTTTSAEGIAEPLTTKEPEVVNVWIVLLL